MKKRTCLAFAVLTTAALSALLSGCGGSASSGSASGGEDNKLYVYNWGEYIDEDVITQFEDETGIEVVYDMFETNEEMYPIIEAGGVKYDVVCPSDYMIQRMIENNLLAELNFDNIPNYSEIGDEYKELARAFDAEGKYSVPYCWGTVGIIYNTKLCEELGVPEPTKWTDLWDERLSGEILMQNSLRDDFTAALKIQGHSVNSTDPEELAAARDLLIEQKPLVQAYVIDQVRDKMIGGEAAAAMIYSGEMLYIQNAVKDQGLDYELKYIVPEEGSNYWMDSWVIPANAEHKENAEKWIDFLCRPDIALKNFEYITYSTPNKGAYELLDDEMKNNEALFPDISKLPNCEMLQYLGEDVDALYNEMWKEVKAE